MLQGSGEGPACAARIKVGLGRLALSFTMMDAMVEEWKYEDLRRSDFSPGRYSILACLAGDQLSDALLFRLIITKSSHVSPTSRFHHRVVSSRELLTMPERRPSSFQVACTFAESLGGVPQPQPACNS